MSRIRNVLTALLALGLAACQSAPAAITDGDRTAILSLEDSFAKLATGGHFSALVDLYYEPNAMLMAPNEAPAVGHDAIEGVFRAFPPITAFSLKAREIDGAGDLAYSCGTYSLAMSIPGAPSPVKDEGNTLVIYRRQPGGAWKAWRDIFNSTLPAAGSAPVEPKK